VSRSRGCRSRLEAEAWFDEAEAWFDEAEAWFDEAEACRDEEDTSRDEFSPDASSSISREAVEDE